jgi:hypothetical protein
MRKVHLAIFEGYCKPFTLVFTLGLLGEFLNDFCQFV